LKNTIKLRIQIVMRHWRKGKACRAINIKATKCDEPSRQYRNIEWQLFSYLVKSEGEHVL